eukprot:scaffold5159_cov112-Cylindrotheca_fusiformis.AAC.7
MMANRLVEPILVFCGSPTIYDSHRTYFYWAKMRRRSLPSQAGAKRTCSSMDTCVRTLPRTTAGLVHPTSIAGNSLQGMMIALFSLP